MKAYVMIDSINITKQLNPSNVRENKFDLIKLREYFKKDYETVEIFYYLGNGNVISDGTFKFLAFINFENIHYKIMRCINDHANVDSLIMHDIIKLKDFYDTVVLVSGDGDFVECLERIKPRKVVVISDSSKCHYNLRNIADEFIDANNFASKKCHLQSVEVTR